MSGALREILAVFGTEFDPKGIKDGEKGIEGFKKTLGEAGKVLAEAFALKEIVEFGKEILEQADVLAKQSAALSVSAAELQGWQWAAKLSGSSAEEFSSAFTKFNKNVAAAASGTGPAADALKALGVSVKDSTGKMGQPIDLLDGVADGLAAMQDPAKRTEAVMALFGKSGAKLLPLFQEGSAGIAKLRAEVGELGASFDEAFLENAQEVNDNVDRLKLGVRGLAIQAIGPLLPTLVSWTQKGIDLIKWVIDLTKHSSALQAGLVTFGAVGAVKAITGLVGLAQKAGFLKNGLRGVLLELAPLVLGFLAIDDVWTFLSGGKSITGDLIDKFFGPDASAKVRAFAKALKEDAGPVLSEVFAIFTDGKPLDQKLKELSDYVKGTLAPQFKTDFGDMADSMLAVVRAAGDVAVAIDKVVRAFRWLDDLNEKSNKATGDLIFKVEDAAANENAQRDARAAEGQSSWYDSLRNLLVPDPADINRRLAVASGDAPSGSDAASGTATAEPSFFGSAAAVQNIRQQVPAALASIDPEALRQSVVGQSISAPVANAYAQPIVQQDIRSPITQNFYADTPEDVQKAASDGVKDGVAKGSGLLSAHAAIAKRGK